MFKNSRNGEGGRGKDLDGDENSIGRWHEKLLSMCVDIKEVGGDF